MTIPATYIYPGGLPADGSEITLFDTATFPHHKGQFIARLGIERMTTVCINELAGSLKFYYDPVQGGAAYRLGHTVLVPAWVVNDYDNHNVHDLIAADGNVKITWTSTAATPQAFFDVAFHFSKQRAVGFT